MRYLSFILCLFLIIFCSIFLLNQEKKREKIKQQICEEVYNQEKQKIIERIDSELEELNKQIEEKKSFNDSLLKMREDELQRIIDKEKNEKMLALENELAISKQLKMMNMERELSIYKAQANREMDKMRQEVEKMQVVIEDYHTRRESINKAILREKEIQEKENFYRICVDVGTQRDIEILEQIRPQLKNREALSKLIWEVFIQRPTIEMVKRVTAGRDVSGIYKITYIKTGESYIGKTTNIKTRWQNHIKTVIGLEGAAHSTLHTHMEKNGLWNYTFEILEEVSKDKLTEREKFYIKLYDTTKQLNMREG